jgi:hypothetical protein
MSTLSCIWDLGKITQGQYIGKESKAQSLGTLMGWEEDEPGKEAGKEWSVW